MIPMIESHRDGQALMRAILANPADDLVRLVYADWLDENGRSDQATFIRLQIEHESIQANSYYRPEFYPEITLLKSLQPYVEASLVLYLVAWLLGAIKV